MYYRTNIDELNKKIKEFGTTKEAIAEEIGTSDKRFYKRLQTGNLLIGDIHKLCDVLHLSNQEAIDIFLEEKNSLYYEISKGALL